MLKMATNHQRLAQGPGTDLASQSRKELTLPLPWSWAYSLQNCNSKFLLFKLLSLWSFVMATSKTNTSVDKPKWQQISLQLKLHLLRRHLFVSLVCDSHWQPHGLRKVPVMSSHSPLEGLWFTGFHGWSGRFGWAPFFPFIDCLTPALAQTLTLSP